ncbi:MAG TPA: DUF4382 domain-containing protein [Candidatus Bathyarchaeia archaeon]|nr:DUF4382 domain-containing protein [Candidatus Bathyarchaeia archaeon]
MDLATRKMVYYGLLGLLIAGSTITLFHEAPKVLPVPIPILVKDGTLSVYFKNVPSDISGNQGMSNTGPLPGNLPISVHLPKVFTIVNLNVTIDSIVFHKSGGNDSGWTDVPSVPVTINLLQPTSVSVLIGSVKIPSENVTMVELHVSKAMAAVSVAGALTLTVEQVVVSSENLKIQIDSGVSVEPQMTTSIVADRPHIVIQGNGTIRLTPELSVDSVDGPK